MSFWPRKILLQDIWINSVWVMLCGLIGSILILIIVFATSSFISIPTMFEQARLEGSTTNPMFPFILSFITFIATMVTLFLSALLLHMTDPERYKKNAVTYGQLWFFWIFTYLCITPVYIYMGLISYDNIMMVFLIHCIILAFWSSLILEILNNYHYILIGFYGSFVGLFFTSIIILIAFHSLESGYVKLLSLLIMLPLINTSLVFFKWLFELAYYKYHKLTNLDQLGDIFYQIKQEEDEALREEQQKNNI